MDELFRFDNKVALITGGSRGLGKALSLALAERGADIAVVSRKLANCEAVAAQIRELGRRSWAKACHVGHWGELDQLVEDVFLEFGRVDILINNAGMSPLYPKLSEVSEALFDKVVGVNLKGPYRLSALIGERMMAQDEGGCIVNVSSNAATHPSPNAEPYGACKAGINSLTMSLAHAFAPKVRVNCIQPGPFLTDISKAWDLNSFNRNAKTNIALQRGGEPDEIVGVVLYLAGPSGSYTTGAVIPVDGGSRN